jgi:hypothetical protein
MGLGVWFSEDIAHVLRGAGEGVSLLVAQRGLRGAADYSPPASSPPVQERTCRPADRCARCKDAAYLAGYWAALRTVATSLGLNTISIAPPPGLVLELASRELTWEEGYGGSTGMNGR